MEKRMIKDFYGRLIGWQEVQNNGDIIAKDWYGRLLGSYVKSLNVTKDFYGRVIGHGDLTSSLIWEENEKRTKKK